MRPSFRTATPTFCLIALTLAGCAWSPADPMADDVAEGPTATFDKVPAPNRRPRPRSAPTVAPDAPMIDHAVRAASSWCRPDAFCDGFESGRWSAHWTIGSLLSGAALGISG